MTRGDDRHAAETEPPPLEPPDPPATASRLELRVDIVGAKPPIWRRLSMPGNLTLDVVHDTLQAVFGWTDSHLHRFSVDDDRYAPGGLLTEWDIEEGESGTLEDTLRLDQLLQQPGDTCYYTYDFGDDWAHRLKLEKVVALESRGVQCLDGRRAGPPEDAGGIGWYEHMLDVMRDPDHPERGDLAEQLQHYNLEARGDDFDVDEANRNVSESSTIADSYGRVFDEQSPTGALIRMTDPQTSSQLARYVARIRGTATTESRVRPPTEAEANDATVLIRRFLAHVPADGVTLTSAGYLPPASVVAMMGDLDPDQNWIGEANREAHTFPLLHLRACITALGMVRKSRGKLLLTKVGERLHDSPVELWNHIASRLPLGKQDSEREIGMLLLLLVGSGNPATESQRRLGRDLDQLAMLVGWQFSGGPGFGSPSLRAAEGTWEVLGLADSSELIPFRRNRLVAGPGAQLLAAAAVGGWV